MHNWGDGFPYFEDVGNAADEIGAFCRKWGRIGVRQTKEKYGTARVYCSLGWHQMHCITHPGHCYSRYPNWLWHLDCRVTPKILHFFRLNKLIMPFHVFIYHLAYKRAIKKYPHIREEILSGADWNELLEDL